jgi:hypothetical protein
MAFWSEANQSDPKRQHRWLIDITAPEISESITYTAKKVNKPKMTVGEAEHKFINHTFYYPGGITYDPISITLVDPADPHSTQALYLLLLNSGYVIPDQIDLGDIGVNELAMSTISKRRGTGALSSVVISMIDGDGQLVEKTTLRNAWIKSVDFGGELSYESEGLMECTLEVRFDWFDMEWKTP